MRGSLRTFDEYAARPPARWQPAAAVLATIVIPVALWDKRGPALALAALLVFGWIFLASAFNHPATLAWSRQHVVLDGLLIVPLLFLALAMLTSLSLGICAAVAAAIAVTYAPVTVWRRVRVARP